MDRNWSLEDLYNFPHAYSQVYALIYCFDSELPPRDRNRINTALEDYPWRGGYSYVNIYTVLNNQIPFEHRPQIGSIKYSSPGWIELILNPDVAIQVAKSVGILLGTAATAVKTYRHISNMLSEMKIDKEKYKSLSAEIAHERTRKLMQFSDEMANHIGFSNVKQLHKRTKDPEVSTKVLLAHYRRLKKLSTFVESGQATFPEKIIKKG